MRFVLLQKKTSQRIECVKVKLIAQYFFAKVSKFFFVFISSLCRNTFLELHGCSLCLCFGNSICFEHETESCEYQAGRETIWWWCWWCWWWLCQKDLIQKRWAHFRFIRYDEEYSHWLRCYYCCSNWNRMVKKKLGRTKWVYYFSWLLFFFACCNFQSAY